VWPSPQIHPSVRGMDLLAPRDAPARSHVHTRRLSRRSPHRVEPPRQGGHGRAWRYRQRPVATQPSMTRPSTQSSRNGLLMGRYGRQASSLWPPRAAAKHLETSVFHGHGTHTVVTTGAMELDRRGTSLRRGSKVSQSQTIMALSSHQPLWLPSMRRIYSYGRRDSTP